MNSASLTDSCHSSGENRSAILRRIRTAVVCLMLSILVHLVFLGALRLAGSYRFGPPVSPFDVVTVDLGATPPRLSSAAAGEGRLPSEAASEAEPLPPSVAENGPAPSEPDDFPAAMALPAASPRQVGEPSVSAAPVHEPAPVRSELPLKSGRFLPPGSEKLKYLISWLGVPVGSAELEATSGNGEMRIVLRIRSNAAVSGIFPVDDEVETRHIDGRFIMVSIRQREGTFSSDEMFSINLGKKRVSWMDRLRGTNLQVSVPADDVMDTLSGIYLLRNRKLEVGRTETLHIFDSEIYAEVPVEILRRERIRLPNLRPVDTLVVRPLQKTAGMFRRTGEVLIWMSDDGTNTPLRIDTTVALGRITAELISAERSSPGENHSSLGPPP